MLCQCHCRGGPWRRRAGAADMIADGWGPRTCRCAKSERNAPVLAAQMAVKVYES